MSVCHASSNCFFLFLGGIEPFFGVSSPCGTLQNVVLRFWICCYGNNIWAKLGYFSTKSPMSRLVCQIDQIWLGLPEETNSGADLCCQGNDIWEARSLIAYQLVCMFVCNAPSILQIDSSSLFLDGIAPFLGHQFSMTKATKRCSSNFDLLPWQRNLGYFC